eukprot:CAMPEP_0175934644 /NCGR_PEP_ID=MMETSP0108-20121206/20604_1 /TAXON_ID=195067 ORGANISM="Goniomonas pacifica, Strain CCMP1869" /NCGR_SAMPLE_ID=MMETSP0108 /ASSEMBLY_ACC=CAM_ASM_000204 /LENGTH=276 /DNA_ID=CAMNT_0017258505 /DNA_START=1 /DNA_END=831 /DNA_ORIENTATION=+
MVVDGFVFKSSSQSSFQAERRLWRLARETEAENRAKRSQVDADAATLAPRRRRAISAPVRQIQLTAASTEKTDPLCWLCTTPMEPDQRAIQPFDDCQCSFHRPCILSYSYRRGECPKCRMIGTFEEGNLRYNFEQSSLLVQMYGHEVSKQLQVKKVLEENKTQLKQSRTNFLVELRWHITSLGLSTMITTSLQHHTHLPPGRVTVEEIGECFGVVVQDVMSRPLARDPKDWGEDTCQTNLQPTDFTEHHDIEDGCLSLQAWRHYHLVVTIDEYAVT